LKFFVLLINLFLFSVVDILLDVTHSGTLNAADIDRQRGVILREMDEIEKNNQQVYQNFLESVSFLVNHEACKSACKQQWNSQSRAMNSNLKTLEHFAELDLRKIIFLSQT